MIAFELPGMALTGSLNSREHWRVKQRREKPQKAAALLAAQAYTRGLFPLIVVTITRVGPRKVDSDNLQGYCKGVRDQVAKALGIDDGHKIYEWRYVQERGEYAVRVAIEVRK
jgi:hypothetical protein